MTCVAARTLLASCAGTEGGDMGSQQQQSSNVEQLEAAGFVIKENTPQEYIDVLEGMNNNELNTLIDLKQRLDEAEATRGEPGPEWQKCVIPF
jgi:hypothetical protein